MDYSEALKIAAKCNIGLLILRDENIEYGTKIFDYIGLNLLVLDNFEKDSIFRYEFSDFIHNDDNIKGEMVDKKGKFKRENIYRENIEIFQ